jgi:hypothetical protein
VVGIMVRGKGRLAAMIPAVGLLAASLGAVGSPAQASVRTREISALRDGDDLARPGDGCLR